MIKAQGFRPFMVIAVCEPRTTPMALVTEAVKGLVEQRRHGSLVQRIKEALAETNQWPKDINLRLPIVAEIGTLSQVDDIRAILVKGLRQGLGLKVPVVSLVSHKCCVYPKDIISSMH